VGPLLGVALAAERVTALAEQVRLRDEPRSSESTFSGST
jgi:hypothetical protein